MRELSGAGDKFFREFVDLCLRVDSAEVNLSWTNDAQVGLCDGERSTGGLVTRLPCGRSEQREDSLQSNPGPGNVCELEQGVSSCVDCVVFCHVGDAVECTVIEEPNFVTIQWTSKDAVGGGRTSSEFPDHRVC